MNRSWQEVIPENLHEPARQALSSAFGSAAISETAPVPGGASGALTFRIEVEDRPYLLRIEARRGPLRNPHQYAAMRIAAQAGIAPAVHYLDDAAGVVVMDFIKHVPLEQYPGGPLSLATALGALARRLQETAPFPVLGDYRVFLERMLAHLRKNAEPGLLDPHTALFGRIREAYPWDASGHVSSHNDPNPRNILFDGGRLWLIDWETSYRNDPFTDVAVMVENHARAPELQAELLRSWLGATPSPSTQARLELMRLMTRLYYGGLLLGLTQTPSDVLTSLAAPTPEEFRALAMSGQLKPGPETLRNVGKMCLTGFLSGADTPDFERHLAAVRG